MNGKKGGKNKPVLGRVLNFEMTTPSRRRARPGARTVALRAVAYFSAAWGKLSVLAAGSFPGAAIVVLGLAA